VTGDADFAYLAIKLRRHGIRVEVASVAQNLGHILKSAANDVIDLAPLFRTFEMMKVERTIVLHNGNHREAIDRAAPVNFDRTALNRDQLQRLDRLGVVDAAVIDRQSAITVIGINLNEAFPEPNVAPAVILLGLDGRGNDRINANNHAIKMTRASSSDSGVAP